MLGLSGVSTVIAGDLTTCAYTEGASSANKFNNPFGISLSSDGSMLFIADKLNYVIRSVTKDGECVTSNELTVYSAIRSFKSLCWSSL